MTRRRTPNCVHVAACRTTNAPLYAGGAGSRGVMAVAVIASGTGRLLRGRRTGAIHAGSASPRCVAPIEQSAAA